MESVEYYPGYYSPLGCWSCKSYTADLGACLFTSYDGLIYFHCGKCSKKCRVIGCNECLPNQSHRCKWCHQDDVSHQEKDCQLLKRLSLSPKQLEFHLKAQSQSEKQRYDLILEEKAILLGEKKLKDEMLYILSHLKTHDLEIIILSSSGKENFELMRKEVKTQIDEYLHPNLMSIINHKVKNFPLLITY